MKVVALTADNFSETLEQHDLVVVDFWAAHCEPCESFKKIVEIASDKYPDVLFATVDVGQEKALAKDFQIVSVPTIMILRHQVVVYADSGLLSFTALKELIEKAQQLTPNDLQ